MSTGLLLPSGLVPSNLHLPLGSTATCVENDVFDICARLKDVSPDLHVWCIQRGGEQCFSITETSVDGVERLVFKVGPGFPIDALDARVVTYAERLLAIPFEQRFAEVQRENDEYEAKQREVEHDDLYERLGRPMLSQMEHDGFIQRPVSYPKAGVATRGRTRR